MRNVIYQGPTVACLATTPVGRGGFQAAAGAHLDLDEVIGADHFTIADALGPLVEAHCVAADQVQPAAIEGLPVEDAEAAPTPVVTSGRGRGRGRNAR